MVVNRKCMFRNESVPWYKVCLSAILLSTANCTISVEKFNTKMKQYFFFKVSNGKVYGGNKANQNFTNQLATSHVSNLTVLNTELIILSTCFILLSGKIQFSTSAHIRTKIIIFISQKTTYNNFYPRYFNLFKRTIFWGTYSNLLKIMCSCNGKCFLQQIL